MNLKDKQKSNLFSALLLFIVVCGVSFAQQRNVKGSVKDHEGSPLPGVSILVKNTIRGTETDFDGNFEMQVSANEILVFSYIGMKTKEIKIGNTSTLNIVLEEDALQLDGVVVTGYGTQNKSSIAGSIHTVKADQIAQTQETDVVKSLTGKVSGVQIKNTNGEPGSTNGAEVRFRGVGSISSSNDPLYVVDGIPFNGAINTIAPQDIESISFLKDASANALYGSRGANGVIVITTKKGKSGNVRVSYESKIGFNTRAVEDYEVVTDPKEFYELRYNTLKQGRRLSEPTQTEAEWSQWAADNLIADLGYNALNVPNNQIIDPATGKVNPNAQVRYADDWHKELFGVGIRNEQAISFSYGNDKVSTYLSAGYLDDKGYLRTTGFERYTSRANIDYNLSDKIKLGSNVNIAKSTRNGRSVIMDSGTSNAFRWARVISNIFPVYARDRHGNFIYDQEGNRVYDFGDGETSNFDGTKAHRNYSPNSNPVGTEHKNVNRLTRHSLNARLYASVDFWNNFNFRYNFGYDFANSFVNAYDYEGAGDAKSDKGRITNNSVNSATITHQQLLSWKKDIGHHSIDVMIGHESSEFSQKILSARKIGVVATGLLHLGNAAKINYADGYEDTYSVEGYLSRLNYSYDKRYFVNASFRRDGSSVFHPDNRWGNFYGVGLAWNVTQEHFFPKNEILTNLKLKTSYGEQGNDNINYPGYVNFNHRKYYGASRNYLPYITQYDVTADANGNPSIREAYLGNKDVKWEVSRNFNVGAEVNLFNRVSIEAEYFVRKVSDLLYNQPQRLSSGNPSITKNIGDMENRGVEITLNTEVLKTTHANLSFWLNATHYKNKITKLPEPIATGYYRFVEGESIYKYYLRQATSVNPTTGLVSWYQGGRDKDTHKQTGDRVEQSDYSKSDPYLLDKTPHPDVYGGFGLDFKYKNWSLSAGFSYQLGGYVYDAAYQRLFPEGQGYGISGNNYHVDARKAWSPNNPHASLPVIQNNNDLRQYADSDLFLIGADYIALENISVSYELKNETLSKIGIQSANLGVMVNNVALWSKRQGLDPRTLSFDFGYSRNIYSPLRAVSFNFNLNF